MDESKNKQREADLTVREIENGVSAQDEGKATSHSPTRRQNELLGEAIRASATSDFPDGDDSLRELLVTTINSPGPKNKPNLQDLSQNGTQKTSWRSMFAIAASLTLMASLGFLLWTEGQHPTREGYGISARPNFDIDLIGGSDGAEVGPAGLGPFIPEVESGGGQGSESQGSESSGQPQNGESQGSGEQSAGSEGGSQGNESQEDGKGSILNGPYEVTNGCQPVMSRFEAEGGEGQSAGNHFVDGEFDFQKLAQLKNSLSRTLDQQQAQLGSSSRGQLGGSGGRGGIGEFGGGRFYEDFGDKSGQFAGIEPDLGDPATGVRFRYQRIFEKYAPITENEFRTTDGPNAVSTFSIDVDTASYANVRRLINTGQLVPPNAVRIEEMVNYFQYEYEQPTDGKPFSVNMELAACPWKPQNKLLRVGLKGKEIHQEERPASNIVFLLDVSGSMSSADKLPLLKSGVRMMVDQLNENDRVSIVTYAGNAGVALESTPGNQKQKIRAAIADLNAGGSTNGSAGIELAYELAQKNFIQDGTNKVFLATDGDLNVGVTSDEALVELITDKASEGVFLTVLGFGTGNLKDSKLEALADNGNGIYAYIDGVRESHKVLVEGITGSLVTIAKDVKIQIEFNPNEVRSYRLIGYENRILAREDFDNDAKDAGEIGAGHTVTALYELAVNDSPGTVGTPERLKYQPVEQEPAANKEGNKEGESGVAHDGELLTLALRFKSPDSDTSERIEYVLQNEDNGFSGASRDFRFAASVASFGMLLRHSNHRGDATMQWVQETAEAATGADLAGYRKEFVDLVRRANAAR